jgi:hypothetical protein
MLSILEFKIKLKIWLGSNGYDVKQHWATSLKWSNTKWIFTADSQLQMA